MKELQTELNGITYEMEAFKVKTNIKPTNLEGISSDQIDEHFSLYEKYVEQTNKLLVIEQHLKQGKGFANTTLKNDLLKQIAFERNGIFLHEAYFSNLKAGIKPNPKGAFSKLINKSFVSMDSFIDDFKNVCKARGEIWVLSIYDLDAKVLRNTIITEHDIGIMYRCKPLLVIDCWCHSYARDFEMSEKDAYIDTMFKNIDWNILDERASKIIILSG
jgi:superoxide dismutase, Fe-Mn family